MEKLNESTSKKLGYEFLQCGNCGNYSMVFWSGSNMTQSHDFLVIPPYYQTTRFPEHWPKDIGQYWLEAQRSLEGKNWNAAAVMARSAVQLALRYHNAVGSNLKQEIDDLAKKGLLPPVMRDWSHEVRELGNDSTHPTPGNCSRRFFGCHAGMGSGLPSRVRRMASMARMQRRRAVSTTDRRSA